MKVAIVGATGYSGVELIRLITNHPYVSLEAVISTSQSGLEFAEVYPHLSGIIVNELEALEVEAIAKRVDFAFFATPSGVAKDVLPLFIQEGVRCIDVSGDFRLKDPSAYETWYKNSPAKEEFLTEAVYGLSEFFAPEIAKTKILSNPGCYPTATLLALLPIIKEEWVDTNSIIIDAKSGVSGAGRKASLGSHYCEVNENLKAYKLGQHQHIPEIEQTLSQWAKQEIMVTFSTHLIPMTRGIMCTIYINLKEAKNTEEIIQFYQNYYQAQPFVRIRPAGVYPATKEVYSSNYCDLGFMADPRTKRLTIVSVIDNVVKGAAGQALQNLNIMNGWPQETGLKLTPIYP